MKEKSLAAKIKDCFKNHTEKSLENSQSHDIRNLEGMKTFALHPRIANKGHVYVSIKPMSIEIKNDDLQVQRAHFR